MATNEGNIEDIFKEAFESHEMSVSPKVWAGVQSSLAASGAAAGGTVTAGSSIMFQAAAVVGITSLVAIGTVSEIQHQTQDEQPVANIENVQTPTETSTPDVVSYPTEESSAQADKTKDEVQTLSSGAKDEAVATAEVEHGQVDASTHETSPEEQQVDRGDAPVVPAQVAPATTAVASQEEKGQESGTTIGSEKPAQEEAANHATANSQIEKETPIQEQPAPIVVNDPQPEQEEERPTKTTARFTHRANGWISADGDGTNDCFDVQGWEKVDVNTFYIRITDRAGQMVFESRDINFEWCGTDKSGRPLPDKTTCFFQIRAAGTDGLPYQESNAKGAITVIRR